MKSRMLAVPDEGRATVFSMVPHAWRMEPRGNVVGGVLAAVVTLPLSMGLGALAFAPFGPEFAATGVLAGLYAAAFLGLVAVLMGARGVAIYAPRSLVSFMIALVAANLFLEAKWLPRGDPVAVTSAILLLLALSGAFQLGFGLMRLARVVKFIPAPVMAGFQNAASITIMLSQLHVLLGLSFRPDADGWPAALEQSRPLALVVGVGTILAVLHARRVTRRVPPLLFGLIFGTFLYYAFALAGFSGLLGGTLGQIPVSVPSGEQLAGILALTTLPGFGEALPGIVLGAASIAVVASLDVLMSAKIVENLTGRRGNSTQELLSIGAGNLITPLLGGVAGSIGLGATTTGIRGGAHNSLVLLVHALMFLLLVPLLGAQLGLIPRAVIAALVFNAGAQAFDRWTLQLLKRVAARQTVQWASILIDLMVIGLVAAVAIAGEIVAAVLLGVAVSIVVFTLRMSRGVIRREQYGDAVQSRRTRETVEAALLAAHGRRILAVELEGPLFFASAEQLQNRVDRAVAEGVRYLVLDMTRVTELDSTGARILLQADGRLRLGACTMVLCGADDRPELAEILRDRGVAEALTRERTLPDLDRALEWCENRLLASLRNAGAPGEHSFELLDIARGLDAAGREALRAALRRREYAKGEVVFRQGEDGDALYIIARGSASVHLGEGNAGARRLMTFSPGTFFGEMALLDRERRSATVTADEPLSCHVLERPAFGALVAAHPRVGIVVLANLGRELSLRMRRANRGLLDLV